MFPREFGALRRLPAGRALACAGLPSFVLSAGFASLFLFALGRHAGSLTLTGGSWDRSEAPTCRPETATPGASEFEARSLRCSTACKAKGQPLVCLTGTYERAELLV